jgi:hypothetical protein
MKILTSLAASAVLAVGAIAMPSMAVASSNDGEVLSDTLAMEKCGFNARQINNGFYCVKTVEFSATGETRQIGSSNPNANSNASRCQVQFAETVTYSSYNRNGELMEDRTVVEYGDDTEWGPSYAC